MNQSRCQSAVNLSCCMPRGPKPPIRIGLGLVDNFRARDGERALSSAVPDLSGSFQGASRDSNVVKNQDLVESTHDPSLHAEFFRVGI